MPAWIMSSMTGFSSVAGPSVATIFVRLGIDCQLVVGICTSPVSG
jgi:hypothetical protein